MCWIASTTFFLINFPCVAPVHHSLPSSQFATITNFIIGKFCCFIPFLRLIISKSSSTQCIKDCKGQLVTWGRSWPFIFIPFQWLWIKMHHSYTTCLQCHVQQLSLWEFKHSCESSPAESMACLITVRIPSVLPHLLLSWWADNWLNPRFAFWFNQLVPSEFNLCPVAGKLFQGQLPAVCLLEPYLLLQHFPLQKSHLLLHAGSSMLQKHCSPY